VSMSPAELDPSVQVALVTGAFGLGAAILTGMVTIITLLIQTKRHAARADWQSTNNHVDENGQPINQREEITANHAEVMEAVETVAGTVRGLQRDFGRLDGRVAGLRTEFTSLSGRVLVVESTQQREEIERVRAELRSRASGRYQSDRHPGAGPH
jgi:predicted nuclease with TOPRIM domain